MHSRTSIYKKQWKNAQEWVNHFLRPLGDGDLERCIAPGRNHGIWVLGHIVTSSDDLSLYLGKGPLLYPTYAEMFGYGAKLLPTSCYPAAPELRLAWQTVCEKNDRIHSQLTDAELDEAHAMKPTEADYFKTKEEVLLNWALHAVYHAGQLGLLRPLEDFT